MMEDLKIINGYLIPSVVTNKGNLGKYIAKIRIDLGITQKQLAKLIGASHAMVSAIEKRKKPISPKLANNFINEMGLDDKERCDFLKLARMHNVAIEAEKVIDKMTFMAELDKGE